MWQRSQVTSLTLKITEILIMLNSESVRNIAMATTLAFILKIGILAFLDIMGIYIQSM
jgi:hypothetical protein